MAHALGTPVASPALLAQVKQLQQALVALASDLQAALASDLQAARA